MNAVHGDESVWFIFDGAEFHKAMATQQKRAFLEIPRFVKKSIFNKLAPEWELSEELCFMAVLSTMKYQCLGLYFVHLAFHLSFLLSMLSWQWIFPPPKYIYWIVIEIWAIIQHSHSPWAIDTKHMYLMVTSLDVTTLCIAICEDYIDSSSEPEEIKCPYLYPGCTDIVLAVLVMNMNQEKNKCAKSTL